MADDRIARTVEDVRRLAPTPGVYWVRETTTDYRKWCVVQLDRRDTWTEWSALGMEVELSDADFVDAEIVGPIPEPA